MESQKETFDKFADNTQALKTNTADDYDDLKSTLDELDNKVQTLSEKVLNALVTCPLANDEVQQFQQKVDEVQALIQIHKKNL